MSTLRSIVAPFGLTLLILFMASTSVVLQEIQHPPSQEDVLGPLKHDPIEDELSLKPIFEAASREAEKRCAKMDRDYRFFSVWYFKKTILKEKYGIEWRTPQEMNPGTFFD